MASPRAKPPAPRRIADRAPRFIEPMKALGVTAIPPGEWHSEIKLDGYRALAAIQRGRPVEIWSRNELSLAGHYPEVVAGLAKLRCENALLDGEIVALDAKGRTHFQLLQQRGTAVTRPPIFYYVFDLLQLNGRSFLGEAIEVRRAALEKLLLRPPAGLRLSPAFAADPAKVLAQAAKLGLEGIVAKAAGSRYEPGRRSGAWLKCRISSEQEFVIGGYTPPGGSRPHFGALLIGYYDGGKLLYAGKVGTGFDANRLAEMHRLLAQGRRASCPFTNLPARNRPRYGTPMNAAEMRRVNWVRPNLVCQVKFSEWTEGGHLRHPVFVGLRADKRARDVVREAPGIKS